MKNIAALQQQSNQQSVLPQYPNHGNRYKPVVGFEGSSRVRGPGVVATKRFGAPVVIVIVDVKRRRHRSMHGETLVRQDFHEIAVESRIFACWSKYMMMEAQFGVPREAYVSIIGTFFTKLTGFLFNSVTVDHRTARSRRFELHPFQRRLFSHEFPLSRERFFQMPEE